MTLRSFTERTVTSGTLRLLIPKFFFECFSKVADNITRKVSQILDF